MEKNFGWTRRVLFIDLTTEKHWVENPDPAVYLKFTGGKGLAGWYLRPKITLNWDEPELPLLFFTGPLTDTGAPTSSRFTIMSRSPCTGTICDASVGGSMAIRIKRAGYDGIVITGRSRRLCCLQIRDGEIRFTDATNLAGLTVSETRSRLQATGSSAIIGPAAENGVLFATIIIDGHFFAGRGGLGLVMAAKNLKAMTVAGSGKTGVFDKQEVSLAKEEILRLSAASPALKGELGISHYGTGALYDLIHTRRMMPTANFRSTWFPEAEKCNAWQYHKQYAPHKTGCAGCHILCKKMTADRSVLPEYETMAHFTALIENRDLQLVMQANTLCNELGMDTISAAATLACYMEISGPKPAGNAILRLLEETAWSRGEGSKLKLGSYRYAELKNCPQAAITVKKLELPAYDPRGAYGMALAYATSTRGACHLRAYPIAHEILRKPVATDRFTFSGKARIIKISEDLFAVVDSLAVCKFQFFAATLEEYARAFYGVTGQPTTAQDLLACGERIYYHERLMNSLNGFSAADDDLPERFFTEPGSSGDGINLPPLDRQQFLESRAAYYRIRGLDEAGLPRADKCAELELPC